MFLNFCLFFFKKKRSIFFCSFHNCSLSGCWRVPYITTPSRWWLRLHLDRSNIHYVLVIFSFFFEFLPPFFTTKNSLFCSYFFCSYFLWLLYPDEHYDFNVLGLNCICVLLNFTLVYVQYFRVTRCNQYRWRLQDMTSLCDVLTEFFKVCIFGSLPWSLITC